METKTESELETEFTYGLCNKEGYQSHVTAVGSLFGRLRLPSYHLNFLALKGSSIANIAVGLVVWAVPIKEGPAQPYLAANLT